MTVSYTPGARETPWGGHATRGQEVGNPAEEASRKRLSPFWRPNPKQRETARSTCFLSHTLQFPTAASLPLAKSSWKPTDKGSVTGKCSLHEPLQDRAGKGKKQMDLRVNRQQARTQSRWLAPRSQRWPDFKLWAHTIIYSIFYIISYTLITMNRNKALKEYPIWFEWASHFTYDDIWSIHI